MEQQTVFHTHNLLMFLINQLQSFISVSISLTIITFGFLSDISNDWKMVWGESMAKSTKNGTNTTITLSYSFTNAGLNIIGTAENLQVSMFLALHTLTTTNFIARGRDNSSSGYDINFHYIAIGY